MRKLWSDEAWEEYLDWQKTDRKTVSKINSLIQSIEREGPMKGLGKPEPLRHRKGYSRRITDGDRLVYDVESGILYIYSCTGHYEE
jgi:toxin YoeB